MAFRERCAISKTERGLTRLAPDAAIAARNRRSHALSGCLVAKALPAPAARVKPTVRRRKQKAIRKQGHHEVIMRKKIGYVTILVRDYDEAIAFYTGVLRFDLIEDTALGGGKRWVLVAPPGTSGTCLLLAKASTSEQADRIGNQTGGRVFLFLHTDDFWRDYNEMRSYGLQFMEEPRQESYGTVAVFVDLYGNRWDLLELRPAYG